MTLGQIIPGVCKIVFAFIGFDGRQYVRDGLANCVFRAFCGFSQLVFGFGKELLDRVQIGRVFRQQEEFSLRRSDRLPHGFAAMRSEIVHDNDVAGLEHGDEDFFDVEPKALAVDGAIDKPRRLNVVSSERRDERHRVPMSERRLLLQSVAARGPPPQRRHIRLSPGFINENEPVRVDPLLIGDPLRAPACHIRPVLLDGYQRLFL